MNVRRRLGQVNERSTIEPYDDLHKVSNVRKHPRRHFRNKTAHKQYLCFIFIFVAILLLFYLAQNQNQANRSIELNHNTAESSNLLPTATSKDPEEDKICQPLVSWQNDMRMNCNTLHEFSLTRGRLMNAGYIRSVWQVSNDQEEQFVMKTLLHDIVTFSRSRMKDQARDATISDELAASDFIADIYGYCGFSGLYDLSHEGSLDGTKFVFLSTPGNESCLISRSVVSYLTPFQITLRH